MQNSITRKFLKHEADNLFTSIQLNISSLKSLVSRNEIDFDSIELIQEIDECVDELISVFDILVLHKAGFVISKVRVSDVLKNTLKRIEELYNAKRHKIVIRINNDICIDSNKLLLASVFMNLIKNAVLYCPPKSRIEIYQSVKKSRLIIEINDNGKGLSDSDKSNLFKIGYRGLQSKNTTGSGLGLSIVEEILGKLKGNISIKDSAESDGCSFIISLPLKQH